MDEQQQRRPRMRERNKATRLAPDAPPRPCAWPDCPEHGAYPAPRARDALRDYVWYCLEHVRAYNRGWDYFAGMDAEGIDDHRRADTTWHRPSWRFGGNGYGPHGVKMGPNGPWRWRDPLDVMEEGFGAEPPPPPKPPVGKAAEMLAVMQLSWGFTLDELKRRYKALVKLHHPDLHGGDRVQEERLKRVNEAYAYLKDNKLYV
ncbi:MAG: J domain-containing protein [Geminicoccaceae bacterium]|nr:J domain-containing protein [Geminicoccaceae bacterium]